MPQQLERSTLPGTMVDPLSDRELHVLRLLASDLSGPEIASELFVSIHTFRTHTKRIFTKLDVTSRRAAVSRGTRTRLAVATARDHQANHIIRRCLVTTLVLTLNASRGAAARTQQRRSSNMTITTTKLTSVAGLAAIAAGLIFILIQFIHPPENAATVTTVEWATVSLLTATMATLAIVGISGLYLRNVQRMGVLGLIGYVLFATASWSSRPGPSLRSSSCHRWPSRRHSSSTTSWRSLAAVTSSATLAPPRWQLASPPSATYSAVCSSASRCSAPASWRAGPHCSSRSAASSPSSSRCYPTRSNDARAPHGRRPCRSRVLAVESAAQRQHSVGHRSTQCPARSGRHPMSTQTVAGARRTRGWLPFGLIALVVIPAAGGVARLVELSGGPTNLPAKPHVTESPLPLILHIIAALAFALLGAFQFSPRLRRRRRRWHRLSGRVVVALGFVVALTALWLNQITPRPTSGAQLLYLFRLAAGRAWRSASSSASPRSDGATSPATEPG